MSGKPKHSTQFLDSIEDLNERQREAAMTTEGSLLVLAGAGSGKTKMLTARIGHLVADMNVPPYQILAVTFTNKAAAEMRERVSKLLTKSSTSALNRRPQGQGSNRGGASSSPGDWFGGESSPPGPATISTPDPFDRTTPFGATEDSAPLDRDLPYRRTGLNVIGLPEIGTFHSVCIRILRRELPSTPFNKPFVIYDDGDQLNLLKDVLARLLIDEKAMTPKSAQYAINRYKCDAIEPHQITPEPHNAFERRIKPVYELYQKELFANNALDFGEIICMTYRLLRDNPELRSKYQRRFRYVHVDEYQDTNRAQYLLLSALCSGKNGGNENICVVGDEDQSIYKWRGADIRNILDFELDYPGAATVKLEQNYRSTQTIIQAAGEVIRNNRSRKDKTLWTDNAVGAPIVHAQLTDEREEAEFTIRELKKIAGDEMKSFGDFALFYRTNAQSRQFEDVLRREKIPYQIVGGLRFYDRKEIKDVLAYLKAIYNPDDSVSLKRIINSPARGIGKTTIEKIEAEVTARRDAADQNPQLDLSGKGRAQTISFWSVLLATARGEGPVTGAAAKKIGQFVAMITRLQEETPKVLLSELYHQVLNETNYVALLRAEGTDESMDRIENLEELDTLILEFEEDLMERVEESQKPTIRAQLLERFIEQTTLSSEVDQSTDGKNSVQMMTLHASKGLEFPVVFLAGMEEGLFPSVRPWESSAEDEIEEERRLCYVGMTRARERLYLLNVVVRRLWGNVNYQEPSRFLTEIGPQHISYKDYARVSRDSDDNDFDQDHERREQKPSTFGRSSSTALVDDCVGSLIEHPEYGQGRVILSEGSGDDRKVIIEFPGKQRKKFVYRYVASYLLRS